MDIGETYIKLEGSSGSPLITGEFLVVGDALRRMNEAFVGGDAVLCQTTSGQVYATFATELERPTGCDQIFLVAYGGDSSPSFCVGH